MPSENRSVDNKGSYLNTYRDSNATTPQPIKFAYANTLCYSFRLVRNSVSTPGFHNPKRTGSLPINNFSFSSTETHLWQGYQNKDELPDFNGRNGNGFSHIVGNEIPGGIPLYCDSPITNAQITNCNNAARNKLLLGVKNSSINVAQAYAERKQTMNLIAENAKRIAKSLIALRKGKIAEAAEALGVLPRKRAARRFSRDFRAEGAGAERRQTAAIARGWLELQYGWKPLISDVYGAAEHLARQADKRKVFTVQQGSKVTMAMPQHPFHNSQSGFNWKVDSDVYVSGSASYSMKTRLRYAISSPPLQQLSSLGITNPLLIAWELTPFSFVADWFLPLGNAISTLDATLGLTFVDGFETSFAKSEGSAVYMLKGKDNLNYRCDGVSLGSKKSVSCTRVKIGDFPSPSLPSFKNPMSGLHAANAIALLVQLFRK